MSTKLPQDRQTCYSMIMKQPHPASTQINTMDQREQLIEDINSIVESFCMEMWEGNYPETQEELTHILCDAVYKNFPIN